MGLRIVCTYTVGNYLSIDRPLDGAFYIPFGIAHIATALSQAGHEVRTLVLTPESKLAACLEALINDFKPQLLCLTSVSTQFGLVKRIAQAVKATDQGVYIVLGGHHASLNPEDAISCPYVDAICVGEGEKAVVELASQVEEGRKPGHILNLWLRDPESGKIERNPLAPFLDDLDQLPFIDREMWRSWILEPDTRPMVLIGRGCPNRCSYCSNHAMSRLAKGKYVRFRSPANVVQEIAGIVRDSTVNTVHLQVETIGASAKYALELSDALKAFNALRTTPISFEMNLALTSRLINSDAQTDSLLTALSSANVRKIDVGLESGSERIRKDILRRPHYTNGEFIRFCKRAAEHGIGVAVYVMIGLPTETPVDWRQTLEVLRESEPTDIQLGIFYPYPGTDICKFIDEDALSANCGIDGGKERRGVAVKLPGFPRYRIIWEYVLCDFKVYKGRRPLGLRSVAALRRLIGLWPSLGRFYYRFTRHNRVGGIVRRMIPRSWRHSNEAVAAQATGEGHTSQIGSYLN